MKKHNILVLSIITEGLIISLIFVATLFSGWPFAVFYNIGYGLLASVAFPILFMLHHKEPLASAGIKIVGSRQFLVLIILGLFSVGGQLLPKIIAGDKLAWGLLPICILPLMMTTFFEEFLFRGFFQTRIEKRYGTLIAILCSAAMFSFYHLGYPGFRTLGDLLLLFAVGIGFAVAYWLSDNNLIVSYFVNLPNAFITYILKSSQFPVFTYASSIYAAISMAFIIVIFVMWKNKMKYI